MCYDCHKKVHSELRKNKQHSNKKPIWIVEAPRGLDQQLEEYVDVGSYSTKSEFIRTAVRDRLEKEIDKLNINNPPSPTNAT